jgi:hypothetical protein
MGQGVKSFMCDSTCEYANYNNKVQLLNGYTSVRRSFLEKAQKKKKKERERDCCCLLCLV